MKKELKNLKKELENNKNWLCSWHCNIAAWIDDNCNIEDHKQRNHLASQFIKHFFGLIMTGKIF